MVSEKGRKDCSEPFFLSLIFPLPDPSVDEIKLPTLIKSHFMTPYRSLDP